MKKNLLKLTLIGLVLLVTATSCKTKKDYRGYHKKKVSMGWM